MKDCVLVVDDSPQNRMVAVGHLEAAGYEVAAVGSGAEALAYVRANRVDLIVLDVLMPGMGGFEVCKRIRAMEGMAGVPVMFLTALGDREATQPALDAGADDLLPKPFQRAELLLRVRSLIRQRRQALELSGQNEQLRKLEQDKRRIAQLIVHDLRIPATALMANAELLRGANLADEHAEVVDDIVTAVEHLDRTVRTLLDLSRAEDVGLSVQLEPLPLRELTAEVLVGLRGLGRLHRVTIAERIEVDTIVGDRQLMRRMLQNLVHNAIRHAPAETEIGIEVQRDGAAVLMCVSDAGPGVPDVDADKIFDAYVSLDRPSAGHGLGLVFCRLAAEAHGGRIWVEDGTPGAVFCIEIPDAR